jgi:hypothetical protein
MRKILIGTLAGLVLAGLVACAAPGSHEPHVTPLPAVQAPSTVIAEGKVVPASSVI